MALEIRPEELRVPTPQEVRERLRRLGDRRALESSRSIVEPVARTRSERERIFAEIVAKVCDSRGMTTSDRENLFNLGRKSFDRARAEVWACAVDRRRIHIAAVARMSGVSPETVLSGVAWWRQHAQGGQCR